MHPLLSVHAFLLPLLHHLMAGHRVSRILQRSMAYVLVNGGLSSSRLEKMALGSFLPAATGGGYGLNWVLPNSYFEALVPQCDCI